jgi:hypothetical protein
MTELGGELLETGNANLLGGAVDLQGQRRARFQHRVDPTAPFGERHPLHDGANAPPGFEGANRTQVGGRRGRHDEAVIGSRPPR